MMSETSPACLPWRYRVHGFELESALELPGLWAGDPDEKAAEVVLRFGRTPEQLESSKKRGVCYQAAPGEMLCWLPEAARFHVTDGKAITVEAVAGVLPETLRHLVLSSPMAALLLQRGLLPVHASAVATPRGAVVFAAATGLGKSTLAAALSLRGFHVLADDVTAMCIGEDGRVGVMTGDPCLRLWPDSARVIMPDDLPDSDAAGFTKRLRVFKNEPLDKQGAIPLAAIYTLGRGEAPSGRGPLIPLAGTEALAVMLDLVYRPGFARGMGLERQVLEQAAAVVRAARVTQLMMPADRFVPDETADRVLEDMGL